MRSQKQIKRTHRIRSTRNAAACKRKAYRKRLEAKQVWQNNAIFTGYRLSTPSAPVSHPHKGKEPKQRSPEEIAERQRNREQKRMEKELAKQKASTSAVPKPKNVKKERRVDDEPSQKKLQPKAKKERAKTVVEEAVKVARVKPTETEITAKKLIPTESSAAKPKKSNKNHDVVTTDKAVMQNDLKKSGAVEGAESGGTQKLSNKKKGSHTAQNPKGPTAAADTEALRKDETSEGAELLTKVVTKPAETVNVNKAEGREGKSETKNLETTDHTKEKQKHEKSAKGRGNMAAENRGKKRMSSHEEQTPEPQNEVVNRDEKQSPKAVNSNKAVDMNGNHSLEHGRESVEVPAKPRKKEGGKPKSEKRNDLDERHDVMDDLPRRGGTPKKEATNGESPTLGNLGERSRDEAKVPNTGVQDGTSSDKGFAPNEQGEKGASERTHDGTADFNEELGSIEEVIPPPIHVSCCPCEGPEHAHAAEKTVECITLSTGDIPKDHEVVEKTVVSVDSSSPTQFAESVAKLAEEHPELMAKANLDFGENTNAKVTITTYTKKVPETESHPVEKREPIVLPIQREKKPAQLRPVRERVYKLLPRDIQFCTRMIETYGDDYEAMAKDESNVYQETAKSIQRKIRIFRESPQYEVYARSKESSPVPSQD